MNVSLLVKDVRRKPQSDRRADITRKAIQGEYSCDGCDQPAADLLDDLTHAGYHDIAQAAVQGRYDSPRRNPASLASRVRQSAKRHQHRD